MATGYHRSLPQFLWAAIFYSFIRLLIAVACHSLSFYEALLLTETANTPHKRDDIPLALQIRASIATALGAAAARAKLLAEQEDREVENLVAIIIETQVGHSFLCSWSTCFALLRFTC